MILFLDDSLIRTKRFQQACPSALCAFTAEGIISILRGVGKVDYLFLDHDLGDETFVDSRRPDTGMEVVRWIEENRPDLGVVFVHSLNPYARKEMVARLKDAGYEASEAPFSNLDFEAISRLEE
jgi:hypothetical protein